MGAICNGIAAYGLWTPFCATFFVFSDYMSASVRIAALSHLRVFYIWTHDSIGVGEDGATHQPIEQLSHFRAMPNLLVFRPADGNENAQCWKIALSQNAPCAFVLSRQNLPIIESQNMDCEKGAYIVRDFGDSHNDSRGDLHNDSRTDSRQNSHKDSCKKAVIISSGSEVHLALDSAEILESKGVAVRVVSVPCFDLLIRQDSKFIARILGQNLGDSPKSKPKVFALEASRALEWYRFADFVIGIDSFGKSGKGEAVFKHFGFSKEIVAQTIASHL